MAVLFQEQALTFFEENGDWQWITTEPPFIPEDGKKYAVYWDGAKYTVTAYAYEPDEETTGIVMGADYIVFPENPVNNVPFALVYMKIDEETEGMLILSLTPEETHTVAIYSVECGVCLKDRTGSECVYSGVNAVKLKTEDGGFQLFAKGEAAETTVIPSFASGNMEVEPEEGKLFNKVVIEKPANLMPENIMKDVNIAGVIGTAEGGGSGEAGLIDYKNVYTDTIDNHAYFGLDCFRSVTFTKAESITTNSFMNCNNLEIADFHVLNSITGYAFAKNPKLVTLIIRTNTMCVISSGNGLGLFGTKLGSLDYRGPIALGTGYIYVPAALVETYKADAEWSKYATQFRAIEDYPDICG